MELNMDNLYTIYDRQEQLYYNFHNEEWDLFDRDVPDIQNFGDAIDIMFVIEDLSDITRYDIEVFQVSLHHTVRADLFYNYNG